MNCCREGCENQAEVDILVCVAGREQEYPVCLKHHADAMALAMAMQRLTGMPTITTACKPDELTLQE